MITYQINIVQSSNNSQVNFGASKHECKDYPFFKTLVPVEDRKVLHMDNTPIVDFKGIGQAELVFTSSKTFTLYDVYSALEVRKNLISGFLGFVHETDIFILSKSTVLVGNGHAYGDIFKLNVITTSSTNKVNDSAYICVHSISSLWNYRL